MPPRRGASDYLAPAKFVASPRANPQTNEGKAAKKLAQGLDTLSFEPVTFAMVLISCAGDGFKERIFGIAKGIIRIYAGHYEAGEQDDTTRDAKRLEAVIQQYNMP